MCVGRALLLKCCLRNTTNFFLMNFRYLLGPKFLTTDTWEVRREFINHGLFFSQGLLTIIPVGFIILPPFQWILTAFSFVSVYSWCLMNSGVLACWDRLVFPSVPCLSRCQLVCSQLPFSWFLKVIGLKKEINTHQKVSGQTDVSLTIDIPQSNLNSYLKL